MDRVKFRIKTVLDKFRGWRHRVAPDRGRLVNELATYRHAFETTAADRDRLAVGQIEGQLAAQNLILGMVVFLVWQRDGTLETLPGRVLEWIGDYGRVAGLPRSLLEADDLESRIAEAILAYGDVVWRVDASRSNNSIVPLVGFALKDSSRGLGSYAIACYFRCAGEAGAAVEHDWIARTIARGGYPQNPGRAHIRGFLFQSLQKSGTVFTTRTLSSSLNIPNVVCTYHSPFNRIILDRASLQWPSIERLGIGTNWESLFFRLAPEIVALTSGGGGGILLSGHASGHAENLDVIREQGIGKVVIQMRDPRAAALSLQHYADKTSSVSQNKNRIRSVKAAFLGYVLWNNSWLRARDAGDIDIHVVRHEDLARDETAFMASIYDFLGVSLKDYPLVFPEKTAATHFRTGRIHEWKEVLDAETQAAMADVMRDIPCGY